MAGHVKTKSKKEPKPVLMDYLRELICAQMENRVPSNIPEGITLKEIEDIAHRGQMDYCLLGALLKLDLPQADIEGIRPFLVRSTMKTLAQVCAVREIQERLEEAGVKSQVLKGSVMKFIYPTPELREMSDVDIIVYDQSLTHAESVLNELGYEKQQAVKHHTIFTKGPFLLLEVHWCLFDENVDQSQFSYYYDNFRSTLVEGTRYTYEFSKEDFYVYLISHMAKHFYETGCGIRNLLDVYIYRTVYKDILDEEHIRNELEKCGTIDFEKHIRTLAFIWMEGKSSNSFYNDMFEYMLDCGIYGKGENGVWGKLAKEKSLSGKQKSLKNLYYFPSLKYMQEYYTWLEKCPILLPIAWGMRALTGALSPEGMNRRKLVAFEDKKRIETIRNIYDKVHLDFNSKKK
ncbi:MAG: nucleotidyltransferase family protein [Lachnospiraceae bacterium]|nr:nucleotidyltransferase family protein [Lachnospiraceae bacterium]